MLCHTKWHPVVVWIQDSLINSGKQWCCLTPSRHGLTIITGMVFECCISKEPIMIPKPPKLNLNLNPYYWQIEEGEIFPPKHSSLMENAYLNKEIFHQTFAFLSNEKNKKQKTNPVHWFHFCVRHKPLSDFWILPPCFSAKGKKYMETKWFMEYLEQNEMFHFILTFLWNRLSFLYQLKWWSTFTPPLNMGVVWVKPTSWD